MKVYLVLIVLVVLYALGCNSSIPSEDVQAESDLENEVQSHFVNAAQTDNLRYDGLAVNLESISGLQRLNIYWAMTCFEHEQFILEYNTMLLRELDSGLVSQVDSIILEVELPNSDFGLKRYRASSEELENLKIEYSSVDDKYVDFLHYLMREDNIETMLYFDKFIEQQRLIELTYRDTSYWTQGSFLNYLKTDFYPNLQDTRKHNAVIYVFRKIFGDGSFFYFNAKALETTNYILMQDNQSPIEFTLDDTTKYGLRPRWL